MRSAGATLSWLGWVDGGRAVLVCGASDCLYYATVVSVAVAAVIIVIAIAIVCWPCVMTSIDNFHYAPARILHMPMHERTPRRGGVDVRRLVRLMRTCFLCQRVDMVNGRVLLRCFRLDVCNLCVCHDDNSQSGTRFGF